MKSTLEQVGTEEYYANMDSPLSIIPDSSVPLQLDENGNIIVHFAPPESAIKIDGDLNVSGSISAASFLNCRIPDDQIEQIAKKVVEMLTMSNWMFVGHQEPVIEERQV